MYTVLMAMPAIPMLSSIVEQYPNGNPEGEPPRCFLARETQKLPILVPSTYIITCVWNQNDFVHPYVPFCILFLFLF